MGCVGSAYLPGLGWGFVAAGLPGMVWTAGRAGGFQQNTPRKNYFSKHFNDFITKTGEQGKNL